jgi:hypothetical protein
VEDFIVVVVVVVVVGADWVRKLFLSRRIAVSWCLGL